MEDNKKNAHNESVLDNNENHVNNYQQTDKCDVKGEIKDSSIDKKEKEIIIIEIDGDIVKPEDIEINERKATDLPLNKFKEGENTPAETEAENTNNQGEEFKIRVGMLMFLSINASFGYYYIGYDINAEFSTHCKKISVLI